MLVLTRKLNQSIMIGDEIEIRLLSVSSDKVRIGIKAPRDVPVYRQEVYLSIHGESAEIDDEDVRGQVTTALDELKRSGE